LNPDPWPPGDQIAEKVVGFFITAVTIVVVAVPEGICFLHLHPTLFVQLL